MEVAVVTVGDELLAGETVDTNAAWLAGRLTDRGPTVRRIATVPDRVADIARTVNEFNAEYDAVVVTGGLGPTHDDVTMNGVAAAFGREMEASDAVETYLEEEIEYAREDLVDGTAEIPAGARPLINEVGVAPGCVIGSVYVLPGVPEEMESMFESVAPEFDGDRVHSTTVEADEPESALLDRIETLRERFGEVTVGSYPGPTVRIRLKGTDEATVEQAAAWLQARVESPE
ncbi:MAG: molybdopterin-binding protein [Halobacteriales archaeon]